MKNIIGVVSEHDDNYYFLVSNGKRIFIPIKSMHRMCAFDGLTDSNGFIKNGIQLHLVEVQTDNGTVYYPNHKYYIKRREENQRIILFPLEPFSYGVESECLEFKETFACKSSIKETLVAFANSGHAGTLLVGVDDSGFAVGLQNCGSANQKKLLADDIRNQIKLECASLRFSQTLEIGWETRDGKTICRIYVPTWTGDILFLHQEKLYRRMGSTNQLLKGKDLVDFIVNRCCQSA